MFDKVFKHEVLFIGYLILACVSVNIWAGLFWAVMAIGHSCIATTALIKK